MEIRFITTNQRREWFDALKLQPQQDVYYLPGYHHAYERQGDGVAYAFCAIDGNDWLFHPFLLRKIEKIGDVVLTDLVHDIETVYGYTGPLSTTADESFLADAWSKFHEWCETQNVVAEFIRFNPLLDNSSLVDASYEVKLDRETIAVDLNCSEEQLWSSYPSGQRSKIRKAITSGLTCSELPVSEGLPAFTEIYTRTMDRVGAASYYYFSDTYLQELAAELGEHLKLFAVSDTAGTILAAALFFTYDKFIHYHLGGSESRARDLRPNNLLFHTVAEWGRQRGYGRFHLGGGRSPNPDDHLLRFKKTFSSLRGNFYTGRKVHNPAIYERLCSQWLKQRNQTTRPDYFLFYRIADQ